ncbi:protein kinase [Pontibacter sp. JH31]|uniref:non-specific serine/threonine protein kinase n=1 Tax=Pontibacter aquaedesilientis TaxID=2766980 RepID=A0ABR7XHH0_9BACT|nr:protein kinase [Pontibacter aquaedesilientis]MBD1397732.1 protein kinase [Pontibacter aquaedesilientis]
MSTLQANDIFAEHYLLKTRLSSGPIAEVWAAEDWTAKERIVALKIHGAASKLDDQTLEMLRQEVEEIQSLEHPQLLLPYQFDVFQGIPYQVMPYVEQGSLGKYLLEHGPFNEEKIALLLSQVGSALEYLHTHQPPILHRQVTPDNILLLDNGDYTLTAPGLSNQLSTALLKATANNYAAATAYAAPELFSAHPQQQQASDIFALGVTLYELCTGALPWLGNGGLSLQQGAEVPYLPAPYSRVLSNLVRACLQPDWEKRPSAGQLVEEADYFLENGNWKPYGIFGNVTAETIVYKERPPYVSILLIALLAGVVLAAVYFIFFRDQSDREAEIAQVENAAENSPLPTEEPPVEVQPPMQGDSADQEVKQAANGKQIAQDTPPTTTPPPVQQPEVTPRPALTQKTSYPRPKNLEGYLSAMLDEEIPLQVKDRWRPTVRKYFAPDAIVYAQMNDSPLGSFGVAEFLDILLSSEAGSSIRIDKVILDEQEEKIDEINVSLYSRK